MARHQRVTKHAQQKDEPKKKKSIESAKTKKKVYFFI